MWRFWFFRSLMALYVKFLPVLQNGSENDQPNEESDAITDLQDQEVMIPASEHPDFNVTPQPDPTEQWYHERLHPYIKWSFDFHSVLFAGQSKYQEITILNSKPFGKVVLKQSFEFMDANRDITNDERLQIAYKEAKALLMEDVEEKFDVIVGNLGCCPVESIEEPCTNLMFKTLYEQVVKPKLNPDGIFVTQASALP
ncbi:thermospermine synthase ACAULIS5-like [Senna tora]|uniref:Thermospermine synthase ACAULIS5-like n=1 Tax=Senna tora TaxID=362788 RepID=A0A834T0I9_9FABA|nr:thermospermine synthase ACAULIS5-like [Senna tora]